MKKNDFESAVSHVETAKHIFPSKINNNWYESLWLDDEINECKQYEMSKFTDNPSINNLEAKHLFNESYMPPEEILIIDNFLMKNKEIKSFLSVGRGLGQNEIWLAKKFPSIQFTCIDNAPYVEALNTVAQELCMRGGRSGRI